MNNSDEDGQMIGHSQMWNVFKNGVAEICPAFINMESFKRCWNSFYQSLQSEPRSTLFHLFVAAFGILPLFGFIMFVTGAFLLTFVTGFIAFWFMFFSGLLVFATLTFFILLWCVWLSWITAGALTVWMEWPYINGGVCTIRKKAMDKLTELWVFPKEQTNADYSSSEGNRDHSGNESQHFEDIGEKNYHRFDDSGDANHPHFKHNGNENHHRFEYSGNKNLNFDDSENEEHVPVPVA